MLISGGAVMAQLLTLVSGPLVARMLGADGRGQLALVVVISRMAALLAAGGLPVAVAHAVGSANGPARDVIAERLRRWARWSIAPAVLATVVAVLVLGPDSSWLVALPTAAIAVSVQWNLVIGQMLRGEGSVRNVNALSLSGVGLYATGVAVLFIFHPIDEVGFILLLLAGSQLVSTGVGWLLLRRPTRQHSLRAPDSELYGFARRSFISTINPVTLGVDQLVVGLLLVSADLGLYAAAISMTNLPVVLLSGVAAMLLPRMAARGLAARAGLLRRWFAAAVVIDLVVVIGLEIIIAPAIRILFGAEFVPAIPCARILILAWGVIALRGVLTAAAQAQGRSGTTSVVEAVALVVLVVAGVIGVQTGGINGMAVAFGLSGLTSCVWLARVIDWQAPVSELGEIRQTDQPEKD